MELECQDNKENKLLMFLLTIWLTLNVIFPGELSKSKLILTFVLILISVIKMFISKKMYNLSVLKGSLILIIFLILSLLNGFFRGFEIGADIVSVYIFRPIAIYFIVSIVNNKQQLKSMISSINFIGLLLSVYNLLFILGSFGIIPQLFSWEVESVVIANQDFIAARLTNQAALTFFVPYSLYMLSHRKDLSKFDIYVLYSSIMIGTVASLLSGRRVLQILTIIAVILYFIYSEKLTIKKIVNKFIIFFILLLSVIFINNLISSVFGLDNIFNIILKTILDAFNSNSHSGEIRSYQIDVLIKESLNAPFFGTGINSYVPYFIRSIETPWSYEFIYVAYLLQVGVMGIIFFMIYFVKILKKLLFVNPNVENYGFFKAVFFGSISFIIAGSTNPMILSLWFWFILILAFSFAKKVEV